MQRIFLGIVCVLCSMNVFAQRIHVDQVFGLGGTTAEAVGRRTFSDTLGAVQSGYSLRVKTFGFVYGPKVDLLGGKDFSLSLASPVMLGFSTTNKYRSVDVRTAKTDTTEGLRGSHFAFELPCIADLNFGLRSASDESRRTFGFYAGAGIMYSYTKVKTTEGKIPYDRWEPVFRAGIRMGAAWEKRWSLAFNIRGSEQKTYGLQVLKEL